MGKDRQVCVARELTKLYEEFRRGSASEVKAYYEAHPPKGEIVIIIEGVQTKKVKNEKTV
jgi:16S rRNA (cytidine1402-2'-O)-methyltransferase